MMTVILKPVSRKTLKKPLVSRWYSVATRRVMMVVMSVTEPRLSPIVWSHKSLQNFTPPAWALQQLEITFGLEKNELSGDVGFKFHFAWKFGAKHGHFGSLYVLGMNVCKKVPYPLIWAGWDSLWEDVKGWGHKKGGGGINLIFAGFGVGCQPVDTKPEIPGYLPISAARAFSTTSHWSKFRDIWMFWNRFMRFLFNKAFRGLLFKIYRINVIRIAV